MFEKCQNCGGRVLKGVRDQFGIFCSMECRNFAVYPGFCPSCASATTEKSSGGTYTLNGIGTTLYGAGDPCSICGSVIRTHWICVLYIPVIPLGKYRVKFTQPRRFLSRRLRAA